MFIKLRNLLHDKYLVFCFLLGLLPASFLIHIIAKDFSGFYFLARSFLKYHDFAYQIITNYCDNPINSGLNSRAPLVPFLMAISMGVFGRNLLGILLPFFLARIFLLPFTFLAAKYFLPKRVAYLTSILIIFVPKLQTYSLGSPEADVFVALFYVLAIWLYQKSQKLTRAKFAIFIGVVLGLGALAKSTGFAVGLGFLLAVFLQNLPNLKKSGVKKNLLLALISFGLVIGPYLFWTLTAHKQIYITTQHDRSLAYIPANLPALIYTIPLYLGINFSLGPKASLVSTILLSFLIVGIIVAIRKKNYELLLPTLLTLVLISTLATCVIGGNIPANYEAITILGFTMFPTVILFFIGVQTLLGLVSRKVVNKRISQILITCILLIIMFKFINNYFSAKYAMDFTGTEYYVSLPTVIKNRREIVEAEYKTENGLRIFTGPSIHTLIRREFAPYKFDSFSNVYKNLLLATTFLALGVYLWDVLKNKG